MLAWLKQFFKSQEGNEEVVEKEIMEGIKEIKEEIKETGEVASNNQLAGINTKFPGVVVGKIIEVNNHPNADRLKITKVQVGKNTLDIVCGGPNVAVGQLVPVALVGASLPNGMDIRETVLRGVNSCGMICAEDELGLSNQHEVIMVLEPDAVIGGPIDNYLGQIGPAEETATTETEKDTEV